MTDYTNWLDRLSALNVSNRPPRGLSPHKPLLLLCVMDMIEDGTLKEPWIAYTAELFFRFSSYWQHVYDRQRNRPDMSLPFHALGGDRDRIWNRYTADRQPSRSRETTELCHIDESLWAAMQDKAFRRAARIKLIAAYFQPVEQVAICAQLHLPEPTTEAITTIKKDAAQYKRSRKKGRDSRFRTDVLIGYNFTCALTGYSLCTNNEHMIEAAHIHEHAKSGNDDPRNGLALTPDAHWMFDAGLWTAEAVGDRYIVRVAFGRYKEESAEGRVLARRHDQPLYLHNASGLVPDPACFDYHRRTVFVGTFGSQTKG